METVLKLGVAPSSIVFANPCKRPCDLAYAAAAGVQYMTFDAEAELQKVKAVYPAARMILRLAPANVLRFKGAPANSRLHCMCTTHLLRSV